MVEEEKTYFTLSLKKIIIYVSASILLPIFAELIVGWAGVKKVTFEASPIIYVLSMSLNLIAAVFFLILAIGLAKYIFQRGE